VESYDKSSPASIYEFALRLTGKSLGEAVELPEYVENSRNRGELGSLLEKYYFKHVPGSVHGPDFSDAGVELKITGLHRNSKNQLIAKERLVLTMINYEDIIHEKFLESTFMKKCKQMLCMFYEYRPNVPVKDLRFVVAPLLYSIPERDFATIKSDWEQIQRKVAEGKAHELSEGDTYFLGACRKGAGGDKEALRNQPNSPIGAPARAFSLKQGYFNKVLQSHIKNVGSEAQAPILTYQERAKQLIDPFVGMSVQEIADTLGVEKSGPGHKNFIRSLIERVLAANNLSTAEFDREDIELKTIRLSKSGSVRESMSFPAIDFMGIVEEEWEKSKFARKLDKRFLFVIFQEDENGIDRLSRIAYWAMPYEDRVEARRVWKETKRRLLKGLEDFPSLSESRVAHVRPKGLNGQDKALTPSGSLVLKQAFWLNRSYIQEVLDNF
jgi:DNA mismatch repair protein MutH